MNLTEYAALFPKQTLRHRTDSIQEKMILFDDNAANYLAGPFQGNYAYAAVIDDSKRLLLSETRERRRIRLSPVYLPLRLFRQFREPAKNETHLQKRLAKLSNKELKIWEERVSQPLAIPTKEKPFSLFIAGNDDASWTKFYPSEEEAIQELDFFEANQPVSWDAIKENGFVFTN